MLSRGTDRQPMSPEQQADLTATLAQAVPKFGVGKEGAQLIVGDKSNFASAVITAARKHVSFLRQKADSNEWDSFYSRHFGLKPGSDDRFEIIPEDEPNTFSWSVLVRPELSDETLWKRCENPSFFTMTQGAHLRSSEAKNDIHSRTSSRPYSILIHGCGNFHRRSIEAGWVQGRLTKMSINIKEILLLLLLLFEKKRQGPVESRRISLQGSLPEFMSKPLLCLGTNNHGRYPVIHLRDDIAYFSWVDKIKIKQGFEDYTILIVSPQS